MPTNFGVVKFFKVDRGFGFIRRDDVGADVFVHSSDLRSAGIDPAGLEEGRTRLTFDIERDSKGDKAVRISLAT